MSTFPSSHKNDSDGSTGLIFMRVYNKWHGEVKRRLKVVGITHPQFVILTTLGYLSQFQKEITQVMLANMAGMDVMSVSQILALLEKKDYVKRSPHSKDTRANAIGLTPTGHGKMTAALPLVEEVDRLYFGSLDSGETDFRVALHHLQNVSFESSDG